MIHIFERINNRIVLLGALVLTVFCYFLVYGLYGIHGVDDAWTLSFDYFYLYENFEFDRVFESGNGVVAYFGKTHAYLYGTILDFVGWKRGYAQLISTGLIFLSAWLWYRIALLIGYDKHYAMAAGILMLLLDPFMSTANKARPEALTFLLIALSVYNVHKKHYVLSGIIAGIAIENHPMGLFAGSYVLASLFTQYSPRELLKHKMVLVKLFAGLGVGFVYYLLLHIKNIPSLLQHVDQAGTDFPESWFVYQHFFKSRFLRHLPEFFVWLAVVVIFLRTKLYAVQRYRFAVIAFGLIFVSSLLINHGNRQYGIYLYPALVFLTISVAHHYKKVNTLMLFFCLLMLPQYSFVYWKFRGFDFEQYIQVIKNVTPQNTSLPIVGNANHWFAFTDPKPPNNKIFFGHYDWNKIGKFIYIRDSWLEKYHPLNKKKLALLRSPKQSQLLTVTNYRNHRIEIYQIDTKLR